MNDDLPKNEKARLFPTDHLNPVFLKEDDIFENQNEDHPNSNPRDQAPVKDPVKPNDKNTEVLDLTNFDEYSILLPKKVPYGGYCIEMNKNIPNAMDPEITVILSSLFEKMGEKLVMFDKNQMQNFAFRLPPTIFNEKEKFILGQNKKKRSEVDERLAEQADRDVHPRKIRGLSGYQMTQIWSNASFNTPSPLADHDFTWKLSGWIFSGRKKIYGRFCDACAFSLEQIYEIPSRFYEEKHRMRFCLPNVYSGCYSMYRCGMNLASILVGYPKMIFKKINTKKLKAYVLMQHMEKILSNENIDKTFFLFLDANNNNRKIILEIQRDFDTYWKERKDALVGEFPVDDENYLMNIQELYYTHFYEFIDKSNKLSQENRKLLIGMLQAAVIINRSEYQHRGKAEKKINDFKESIKTNHTFLYKVERWKENQLSNFERSVKKVCKKTILDEATQELQRTNAAPSYQTLLQTFYEFYIHFEENMVTMKKEETKRLRIKEENFTPYRTIEIKRYNYPPGKVKKNDETNKFYLEEYSESLIETSTCGWRFQIIVYRYWNWSNNVTLFLFYNAINGQYGIKALLQTKEFYTNIKVNPDTGETRPAGDATETVISTFRNIMKSIKKSRADFENSPDTGIFGKKFTRICNLMENYLYKFFLLGIILDLICFPLVIVLNTLICILLASTAYVWVFMVVFVFWFVEVFFYDFDNEGDPLGDASNSSQEFPFLFEIICTFLIFGLVQILLAVAFVLLIYPMLMIISVILGILYYFLASFYDCIMIGIIYVLGREPQSNSVVAWKIAGPGVTLDYFNQVELEDIFVSLRAYMEKFELMVFNSRIIKLIEEPKLTADALYNQVFVKSFGTNKPDLPKEIVQVQAILVDKLKAQISQRHHCFPKAPKNVRLSSEELDIVLNSGEKLIVEFVAQRKLEQIWRHYKLKKNEWRPLTKAILSQIFTGDILEPLEELDKRVKLKARQSTYYDKVLEVLKGENADTYKNLILKKKESKGEIKYNEVPPYVKLAQLIKCENYLQSFVNCLYIFTNLEMMNQVMMKEEKKKAKDGAGDDEND